MVKGTLLLFYLIVCSVLWTASFPAPLTSGFGAGLGMDGWVGSSREQQGKAAQGLGWVHITIDECFSESGTKTICLPSTLNNNQIHFILMPPP